MCRPSQRQLTLSLEGPADVQQRQPCHGPGLVVVDGVPVRRLQAVNRRPRLAHIQVQDVAALVVVVAVERDAGERDLNVE